MRRSLLPLVAGLLLCASASAADDNLPKWAKGITIPLPLNEKAANELVVSDPAVWKFLTDDAGKNSFLSLRYDPKTYKSTY